MSRRITAIISALVICIIVCLSWAVNHYRELDHYPQSPARQKCQRTELANAAITDMQMRQRDVAALDAKYTELADAKAETGVTVNIDVAAGRRRLHINGLSVGASLPPPPAWISSLPRLANTADRIISPPERG